MNPFLSIPLVMPDDTANNIQGYDAKGKFLPGQFIGYAEGPAPGTLFIYLNGGQVIFAKITMQDLEEAMRQYWIQIAKAQIKGSNIITLPGAKRN